ncbi:MAG: hypothetical protein ATN35_13400 [Epulopiscium sp. Nele67-Bin004]|nr:MAG: hypothetical protein ATN35_13400 [Epulopiscium sp. Nele67-Bin004]
MSIAIENLGQVTKERDLLRKVIKTQLLTLKEGTDESILDILDNKDVRNSNELFDKLHVIQEDHVAKILSDNPKIEKIGNVETKLISEYCSQLNSWYFSELEKEYQAEYKKNKSPEAKRFLYTKIEEYNKMKRKSSSGTDALATISKEIVSRRQYQAEHA